MRPILVGLAVAAVAILSGAALLVFSPDRPRPVYPASTPEDVLDAAVAMIEDGRPELLPTLIDAPSPEFRSVLNRLGELLAGLRDLAQALEAKFPEQVAALRSAPPPAALSAGGAPELDEGALVRLMADPFSWLVDTRDRLETTPLGEDGAAILVDGAPAFGLGVTMRRNESGQWRIVPPLGLPMLSRFMPQNRDEWSIVASMVTVVDNALRDLARDVRRGRCDSLDQAVQLAGEKAWPPLAICYFAYQRAMEARTQP